MVWLIGMVLVLALVAAGTVYLVWTIGSFAWLRKAAGGRKWLSRLLAFLLLVICFTLSTLFLTAVDAVVILLHLMIFFLLYGLLLRIAGKRMEKERRICWQGWLAILTAAVYLSAGYFLCMHVWKTEYALTSDKDTGTVRIALLSDAHLGTTFDGDGFAAHLDTILQQEPDLILIAGDFVDDGSSYTDLLTACRALGRAAPKYGVWYAYGNHDKGYYRGRDFSAAELEQALEENGVHVLEDETALVGSLCIVGRRDASAGPRTELATLLEGVDPDRYIIVIDHEPTDYEQESMTAADLVVSGHTHGGQLIPLGPIGETVGGNDRTYGYERRNGTDFIVTSGIADWAMHFKTGTRSEYVIITVN